MKRRGDLAGEARRIVGVFGVSMRQAYRYASAGCVPSDCVRVGTDGRRYHVRLRGGYYDPVAVRRIRYMVATVAKRAGIHGITKADLTELDTAARCVKELATVWRGWFSAEGKEL